MYQAYKLYKLPLLVLGIMGVTGCSLLQSAGILNDRELDYQKAKTYNNAELNQDKYVQFGDSYPITTITNNATITNKIPRPKPSFLIDAGSLNRSLSSYNKSQVPVYLGYDISGTKAIKVAVVDLNKATKAIIQALTNINNNETPKQKSNHQWLLNANSSSFVVDLDERAQAIIIYVALIPTTTQANKDSANQDDNKSSNIKNNNSQKASQVIDRIYEQLLQSDLIVDIPTKIKV